MIDWLVDYLKYADDYNKCVDNANSPEIPSISLGTYSFKDFVKVYHIFKDDWILYETRFPEYIGRGSYKHAIIKFNIFEYIKYRRNLTNLQLNQLDINGNLRKWSDE